MARRWARVGLIGLESRSLPELGTGVVGGCQNGSMRDTHTLSPISLVLQPLTGHRSASSGGLLATTAVLLSVPGLLMAQTTATPPAATDLGRVEIRSNRNNDAEARQESTASKIVIGREEIEKQGDSTLGDVLKRLPGVTVQGAPGRGGAIRMRGLGGGR